MPDQTQPPFLALSAEEAANQALANAAQWAQEYGRIKAIAEALSTATGKPVARQMVGRWLNPDPAKRVPTSFGMGLLLLHVVNELSADPNPVSAALAQKGSALVAVTLKSTTPTPRQQIGRGTKPKTPATK